MSEREDIVKISVDKERVHEIWVLNRADNDKVLD